MRPSVERINAAFKPVGSSLRSLTMPMRRGLLDDASIGWFGIRCAIGGMTSRLFSNEGNGLVHFSVSPDPHKARHDCSGKARDSNSQKPWLLREMDDRHSRDEKSYRRSEVSQKRLFVGQQRPIDRQFVSQNEFRLLKARIYRVHILSAELLSLLVSLSPLTNFAVRADSIVFFSI